MITLWSVIVLLPTDSRIESLKREKLKGKKNRVSFKNKRRENVVKCSYLETEFLWKVIIHEALRSPKVNLLKVKQGHKTLILLLLFVLWIIRRAAGIQDSQNRIN